MFYDPEQFHTRKSLRLFKRLSPAIFSSSLHLDKNGKYCDFFSFESLLFTVLLLRLSLLLTLMLKKLEVPESFVSAVQPPALADSNFFLDILQVHL